MEWPWQRFEAFYKEYVRRSAVDELRARKNAMIGGIYANPNFDGSEVSREDIIRDIEENFDNIITTLYDPEGKTPDQRVGENMESNPFFQAMDLPQPPENIDWQLPVSKEDISRFEIDQA